MTSWPLPESVQRLTTESPALAAPVVEDFVRLMAASEALVWSRRHLPAFRAAASATGVLEVLVHEARALTDTPYVWAVLWHKGPNQQTASFRALVGAAGEEVPAPEELSRSLLGQVVENGRPSWSDDALDDPRFASSRSVQGYALRSVGCVPIGTHGALYLHDPDMPGRFDARARGRLTALCSLAADFVTPVHRRVLSHRDAVEPIPGLVGDSPPMVDLARTIRAFAPLPWPALILGETGTGKELVARALHDLSPRAEHPFVAVNCGAIPENLAESTLFGHERGAFTGAERRREGLVERVGGGTLFLDEVGELPPRQQVQLLRLIQEGTYERVGGDRLLTFSGRIIAATHRPIDEDGHRDAFREDLYHRLSGCVIRVPSLDARRGDIPLLAAHLLDRSAREIPGLGPLRLTEAAAEELTRRSWSGNVRQLENVLRFAIAQCMARGDKRVDVHHLAPTSDPPPAEAEGDSPPAQAPDLLPAPGEVTLQQATDDFQRTFVERALNEADGNRTRAADLLGVSRQWLHRLLRRWEDEA